MRSACDVAVIGSGPNGLAAAIVAAQRGLSTVVFEANGTIGGGARSAELTLPGFVHDVCSAVHPMGGVSPFFRSLPLAQHGADRASYRRTVGALARDWPNLEADVLAPIGIPKHPLSYARFGIQALFPAGSYARLAFSTEPARALFAGAAAHAIVPFTYAGSAAIALVLSAVGHANGWPLPRGGSQAITNALAGYFRSLGGEIVTDSPIARYDQLPKAEHLLFDTTPGAMARIMGERLPAHFSRTLNRVPHGPGIFKIDWALSAPIPWKARECLEAATVHVGGTLDEIAASEAAPWRGECAERPFVLVTQPSLFDPSRAPAGKHTAWGYCHVPSGSTVDMTARIEAQVERFAPGFRDVVLARAVRTPAILEADNANLVGGDIGGGSNELMRLLFRPTWRNYGTPVRGVYLCSASTPPGGGVHGMCGYHAATRALDAHRARRS